MGRWTKQRVGEGSSSKTSTHMTQKNGWWVGSKGISELWEILPSDFTPRYDEKSMFGQGIGGATEAWWLASFEASWGGSRAPTPLTAVMSHIPRLKSEPHLWSLLWIFCWTQPFVT